MRLNSNKISTNLTQKAYLNAIASFIDFFVRIGVSLLVTPILVSNLGSMIFGVWEVLKKLSGYISVVDGQPMQALKWVIAKHQADSDPTIKQKAVGCAFGVWIFTLPIVVAAGIIAIWLAPSIVRISSEYTTIVRISCSLFVISIILNGLISMPGAVLRGMNLGYKHMGVLAGVNIICATLMVGAIYLGWGIIGLAAVVLLQSIITGLVFWLIVIRYLPWFHIVRTTLKEIKQYFNLSRWYAAWNLVDKLLLSIDVIILGLMISTSAVADYILTGHVTQMLINIVFILIGATAPGLGNLIGQKKYDKVFFLRNEMLWMSCLFSGAIGAMILLWNSSFITLWVGRAHYAGVWVNLALVLLAVQLTLLRNEIIIIDLTLNIRLKVILGLISAVLSIAFAFILVRIFGMFGLCLGFLSGRFFLTISYPFITGHFLKKGFIEQVNAYIRPIFTMVILFPISAYLGNMIIADTWVKLFIFMALSLPLVLITFWWLGFSNYQKHCLRSRFMRIRPAGFET